MSEQHTARMRQTEMQAFSIGPFDPETASAQEWAQLQVFRRLRAAEDHPGEPVLADADFQHDVCRQWPLQQYRRFVARRGVEIAGNLILVCRREGTPGCEDYAAFVDVWGGVLNRFQRRGVATALLRTLGGFMQESGRRVATMKVHRPESHAFFRTIGAKEKFSSIENRLALAALDWAALVHWRAEVQGLQWEIHAGRVPMERLAQLMAPFSQLINEQPLGSLDIPRMRYDLAGYESWYAEMDQRGGEHFLVLLRDGDEVVALCDASWDARFPERVYQALTAVAARWRGKGLAKAVKAAMLQLLRERHPQLQTMITTNAHANAPMLSINQRLGFAVHRHDATYQIERDGLQEFLAARTGHLAA
ncbi:MAG TPA: GNAT family N-acetyltransferase [Burkholderiaceae bacterium]|nr:GNAT family N-acetyltransferase [Burkholderiaceae bacterium]